MAVRRRWQRERLLAVRLRRCLFGCPAEDNSLRHYMQCERLWVLMAVTAPPRSQPGLARIGLPEAPASPNERFALMRRTAAALHVFRSLRIGKVALPASLPARGRVLRDSPPVACQQICIAPGERYGRAVNS